MLLGHSQPEISFWKVQEAGLIHEFYAADREVIADELALSLVQLESLDSVFSSNCEVFTTGVFCLWTMPSRKFFVYVDAVLEELDLHSDTETCRILLDNAGEDPEFE